MELTIDPWTDGILYKDYAFLDGNHNANQLRPITLTEKMIVDFCFSPCHHGNSKAMANLGYAMFEWEPYHSEDLEEAAKEIYRRYSGRKKNTKQVQNLLSVLPDYLDKIYAKK